MLKSKVLLLTTLLGFSVSSFGAYFPDLFGAYQQGAEQARRDNARDAYYTSRYARPAFIMGVYAEGKAKPKMITRVSIKKHDAICWILYNIPENTNFQSIERFTLPVDSGFAGSSTEDVIGQKRITGNITEFYRKGNSGNSNQFSGCWTVADGMPLGTYSLSVTVGKNQFKTQSFYVVK